MIWRNVKRAFILSAFIMLSVHLLHSCSRVSVRTETFYVMDTFAQSTLITTSDALGNRLNRDIAEILAEVEGRISRTDATSEIYKLNEMLNMGRGGINFNLTAETARLLILAQDIRQAANGAFSPVLGRIIDLWGISNQETEPALPAAHEFFPALQRTKPPFSDYSIIYDGHTGMISAEYYGYKFDLSGIARGYALDRVSAYLESEGIQHAHISLGGASVLALGRNRDGHLWSIGVRNPLNPEIYSGVIQASDKFISAAIGYERYITIDGINYIHIIDPSTGYPVHNDLLGVVVVMDAPSASMPQARRERFRNNGAISDALSTALFVMGRQGAVDFYMNNPFDFEMILFIRNQSDPRGYEILHTNVIFNEFNN